MLTGLFITLIILWFLGYIRIDGLMIPDLTLFSINGQPITLWSILILLVVSWAISILPSPLRQIVAVFLIIWILAVLGIVSLAGIPVASIVVLAIIVGMIFALLTPSDVV
jgi:hypothetical protein